jgi:hypothetical protein
MKESETVCFIKLTTNCTLLSHKIVHPKNMLIKSHDLISIIADFHSIFTKFADKSAPTEAMHKAMFKSDLISCLFSRHACIYQLNFSVIP